MMSQNNETVRGACAVDRLQIRVIHNEDHTMHNLSKVRIKQLFSVSS